MIQNLFCHSAEKNQTQRCLSSFVMFLMNTLHIYRRHQSKVYLHLSTQSNPTIRKNGFKSKK